MADIDENSCQLQEDVVQTGIARIREAPRLKPCGRCYNCNEPIAKGLPFCDADCRDDYEWRTKKRS